MPPDRQLAGASISLVTGLSTGVVVHSIAMNLRPFFFAAESKERDAGRNQSWSGMGKGSTGFRPIPR